MMKITTLRFFTPLRRWTMAHKSACFYVLLLLLLFLPTCGQSSVPGRSVAAVPTHTLTHAIAHHATDSVNVPPDRYVPVVTLNLAYGPLSDERLDLCTPGHAAGLHPGVILIHGGGWQSGSKGFFHTLCNKLAAQGF